MNRKFSPCSNQLSEFGFQFALAALPSSSSSLASAFCYKVPSSSPGHLILIRTRMFVCFFKQDSSVQNMGYCMCKPCTTGHPTFHLGHPERFSNHGHRLAINRTFPIVLFIFNFLFTEIKCNPSTCGLLTLQSPMKFFYQVSLTLMREAIIC